MGNEKKDSNQPLTIIGVYQGQIRYQINDDNMTDWDSCTVLWQFYDPRNPQWGWGILTAEPVNVRYNTETHLTSPNITEPFIFKSITNFGSDIYKWHTQFWNTKGEEVEPPSDEKTPEYQEHLRKAIAGMQLATHQ